MARPIKRLQAEPDVMAELRRRSRSTTIGVRDRERANIILLRTQGLGVEAVAERLSTTPKRVSLWSTRFAGSGLLINRAVVARPRLRRCNTEDEPAVD